MADVQDPNTDLQEEDIFLSIFSHPQIRSRYEKLVIAGKRDLGPQHRGHYLTLACVEYHKDFRTKNLKSHQREILECELLDEVARMAFLTRLNTDSLESLLKEMYQCQNSLRELIIPSPSIQIVDLVAENLSSKLWIDSRQTRGARRFEMLAYFIEQATKRRILFQVDGTHLQFRFQDCPLDRLYNEFTPIEEAIENEEPEVRIRFNMGLPKIYFYRVNDFLAVAMSIGPTVMCCLPDDDTSYRPIPRPLPVKIPVNRLFTELYDTWTLKKCITDLSLSRNAYKLIGNRHRP